MNTISTATKPFVFTLMPFHSDFDDIYKLGIKETCEKSGTYCERVDEQIYLEGMLERIYNQINKADIIVADLSTKNPNVFYELGYAHALNKRVILIIQDINEVPFDLKHHPFIVYGKSIQTLQVELSRRIIYFISHPETVVIPEQHELDFLVRGIPLIEGAVFKTPYNMQGYGVQLDIQNKSNKTYNDLRFGLLMTGHFTMENDDELVRLIKQTDGSILHLSLTKLTNFYPSSYERIVFQPRTPFNKENPLGKFPVQLQIFDSFGARSINFFMEVEERKRDF